MSSNMNFLNKYKLNIFSISNKFIFIKNYSISYYFSRFGNNLQQIAVGILFSKKIKANFDLEEALKIANQFYQQSLRKSPKAIDYLKSRGLTGKIAKEFSIGFAPDGWQNLEKAFKNYQDKSLEKAGLIQKNDKDKAKWPADHYHKNHPGETQWACTTIQ